MKQLLTDVQVSKMGKYTPTPFIVVLFLDALEFLLSSDTTPIDKGVEQSHATPLHYAVQGGHEGCVQLLLDWGAEVNTFTLSEVRLKILS